MIFALDRVFGNRKRLIRVFYFVVVEISSPLSEVTEYQERISLPFQNSTGKYLGENSPSILLAGSRIFSAFLRLHH